MKKSILFVIFILFVSTCKETVMAKEFRYPGQELNGTWQVVKHDLYSAKDTDSPEEIEKSWKSFLSSDDDNVISAMVLPIGQKIVFEMTGESIGYGIPGRYRDGMAIGMKLLFPISPEICKANAWDYLCDKNGNLDLYNKKKYIREKIKDDAYIVADVDSGLLNFKFTETDPFRRKLWPGIKKHSYSLSINDGTFLFFVYPMKGDNEILFSTYYDYGKEKYLFGILLKRIK